MERVRKIKLKDLQELSEKVLLDYADFFKSAMKTTKHELIFDRSRNSFALLEVGWENNRRIHHLIIHLEIINNKIWIQEDNTEEGIAADLERLGLPKSYIVLAFHAPELRKYTEYAIA